MLPDPDLALVAGLGLALLSILSFVSAWTDGRRPVVAGLVLAPGLGLVALALATSPQGYRPADLPMTLFTVLGRYLF